QATYLLPEDADLSNGWKLTMVWTTTATSGTVRWSVAAGCATTNGTVVDDPLLDTTADVIVPAPVISSAAISSTITVPAGSCAGGQLLHIRVSRDGLDPADTIGATARVIVTELLISRSL